MPSRTSTPQCLSSTLGFGTCHSTSSFQPPVAPAYGDGTRTADRWLWKQYITVMKAKLKEQFNRGVEIVRLRVTLTTKARGPQRPHFRFITLHHKLRTLA
ncbi:hypothetical protein PoB_000903500 [Plakobranchus ocellatus]|uniref:Uncharacterized protein n=1 Tax=Plakobranchus ocellatus TaxID=259542 RepID=A0AAV3YIG2_9GAST|nr:hypothetical protein PoB_000903500 [Plakobranchus ocellatus]